jgi:hypothetical protein
MTLRTLFEKQVFIRLDDAETAVVCTTKWPLLSRIRRFGVGDRGRDFGAQAAEPDSTARVASSRTHQTAE